MDSNQLKEKIDNLTASFREKVNKEYAGKLDNEEVKQRFREDLKSYFQQLNILGEEYDKQLESESESESESETRE